jgi:hypothetical protein
MPGCSLTGANAKLAIKKETTFGAKPTGNFIYVPFISADLGATDDVDDTPILGLGADAQRPARDGQTVRGRIVVPFDLIGTGYWLNMLLGADTVTGATNFTHTFSSGLDLPSYFLEFQQTDAPTPIYRGYSGVMADGATVTWGPTGRPRLEVSVIGRDEEEDNTSDAGTPTSFAVTWFHNKQSTLTRDAVAQGALTALTLNPANNLDASKWIGDGGKVSCITRGIFGLTGSCVVRDKDLVLANIAANAGTFDLDAGWSIDATHAVNFSVAQCELLKNGRSIGGPGVVERPFNIRGSKGAAAALVATLINQQAAQY